jgi:hypothetical protein
MATESDKYEVVPYRAALKPTWDAVVGNAKNATFLHYRDYMDYHAARFDDTSVIIFKDNKAIAAFPSNTVDDQVISHSGLTYGGLLIGQDVHASTVLDIFGVLGGYFRAGGKRTIIYKAVPQVFHKYPSDEDLYALNRMGARLVRRDLSSVVELAHRPKFSDSRKNTARKTQKAGGIVEELDDFIGFHVLLTDVLKRFGVKPVHSVAELQLLKGRFPEQIRLFGTLIQGQLHAACLVYDCGHVVHTQYLASSDAGRRLGALDYLILNLIEKRFADKQYISFGISTEENGNVLNTGLIAQKEGFGGRGIVHDFYEWVL